MKLFLDHSGYTTENTETLRFIIYQSSRWQALCGLIPVYGY